MKLSHYLLSKTLSFGLLIFAMSLLIYLPVSPFDLRVFIFIPIVVITSAMFTLMGLGISAQVKSINQYFIRIIFSSILIVIPAALFLLLNSKWLLLLPYNAAIDLLMTPLENITVWNFAADVLLLIVWTVISYLFARRQFERFILNQ